MPSLRAPGLGPIVGHTTPTSCRLWMRGDDPADRGARLASERRTVGVLGVMDGPGSGADVLAAYYFRLHREYDRTGTFVLGEDVSLGHEACAPRKRGDRIGPLGPDEVFPLAPDTPYTVRLGTLTTDDPWPDDANVGDAALAARLPPVLEVAQDLGDLPAEACEATFLTFPADDDGPAERLDFLLGSCRYPGLLWKTKEADRIFGPMRRHVREGSGGREAARFTLMVGDQIYADTLGRLVPLGRADTYAEFQRLYHDAFGAPNMRRLLRSAPVYMILDDHEIENDWTQDRLQLPGKHELFNLAIGAYMSYQWSHGPRDFRRLLYYTFSCAGYPFFVLDTRTQRYRDDEVGLDDNHMLGRPTIDPRHPSQLRRLKAWLTKQQELNGDAPKFVVSSSVFVPNEIKQRLDPTLPDENRRRREASGSWPAYPETRRGLLEHIVAGRIQNVVFLCGDVHCANVAEMRFSGTPAAERLRAFSVTSSSFYWPFPFADGDPNTYVHDSTAPGQVDTFRFRDEAGHEIAMDYRAWGFAQEDNFTRVEVDRESATVTVRAFDRDGRPVTVADFEGEEVEGSVLRLAPWDGGQK